MTPRMRRTATICTVAAGLALAGAGCASDDETSAGGGDGTAAAGGSLSGEIVVSGSSTVEPISTRVAELWAPIEPDVDVVVDGPGTGDGFAAFCAGEVDIADASRPIKAEELATCEENGIELIELKVGIDGLSVLTNPANADVECLSFADLYALVGPESQGFGSWADAQGLATELGSTTTFPDAPLDITAPGEESGTYDSFVELALGGPAEARVEGGFISEDEAEQTRPDYTSQANDNAIIQGIEGSESSFGWVGFAFAEQAGDGVKELAVSEEPGGECVAPTAESIADGSYPLARPLYIYVSVEAADRPEVAAYVDHYLGEGYGAVTEVGYVPLTDEALAATVAVWEARETGTRDGG